MKCKAVRTRGVLVFPLALVLLWGCGKRDQNQTTGGSSASQRADGQKEIYALWEYENQLASMRKPNVELPEQQKTILMNELRQRSFVQYDQRQRDHFRAYRDAILAVATAEGFQHGYLTGDMTFKKNAVLADWSFDGVAARRFADTNLTTNVEALEGLAKSFSVGFSPNAVLPEKKSAVVFAELYLLSEKLLNAPVSSLNSHAVRAGILAVDPSIVEDPTEQATLTKFRAELLDISRQFGDTQWDSLRMQIPWCIISAYSSLRPNRADFIGTDYARVVESFDAMDNLLKKNE